MEPFLFTLADGTPELNHAACLLMCFHTNSLPTFIGHSWPCSKEKKNVIPNSENWVKLMSDLKGNEGHCGLPRAGAVAQSGM